MKHLPFFFLILSSIVLTACGASGKPYPLDTCIVSGEKLGSMGEPYATVKDGQQIKFCCKGCLKDFNQEPEKFLKEIAAKSAKP